MTEEHHHHHHHHVHLHVPSGMSLEWVGAAGVIHFAPAAHGHVAGASGGGHGGYACAGGTTWPPDERKNQEPRRGNPMSLDEAMHRLHRIAQIIEAVDHRSSAADIVVPTLSEMEQKELSVIYALAKGQDENWVPG